MKNKESRIGLLSLLSLIAFIWAFQSIKKTKPFGKAFELYVLFDQVDELEVNTTTVGINGFLVGTVQNISKQNGKIIAHLLFYTPVQLPKTTYAVLEQPSMMGGRSIELKFDQACQNPDCLNSGSQIQGQMGTLSTLIVQNLQNQILSKIDTPLQKLQAQDLKTQANNIKTTLRSLAQTTLQLAQKLQQTQTIKTQLQQAALTSRKIQEQLPQLKRQVQNLQNQTQNLPAKLPNPKPQILSLDTLHRKLQQQIQTSQQQLASVQTQVQTWQDPQSPIYDWLHEPSTKLAFKTQVQTLQDLLVDVRLYPEKYRKILGKKPK